MYDAAKRHFKQVDPALYQASLAHEIEELRVSDDLFRDIIWTIVGQQLSSLAANAIFARFKLLFAEGLITPERLLGFSESDLRAVGLSGAKVRAMRHTAEAVLAGTLDIASIPKLPDEEVIAALTSVKGIGPWTAQMLLMFSLDRPDIFSPGDLGLRKGVVALYALPETPGPEELARMAAVWSPYRSYAARVLWRLADSNKQRTPRKRPEAV